MRNFWSFISNDKYGIGCTGQTAYVLDAAGEEVARFRGLSYAYDPYLKPNGELFVVKSKEGRFYVFDLKSMQPVMRFKNFHETTQDTGACFSHDGKYFYDVESRYNAKNHFTSDIVTYDGETFAELSRVSSADWVMEISCENGLYVLGCTRDEKGIADKEYIARFDGEIRDRKFFADKGEFWEAVRRMRVQRAGFTDKAMEWSYLKDKSDKTPISLEKIFSEK